MAAEFDIVRESGTPEGALDFDYWELGQTKVTEERRPLLRRRRRCGAQAESGRRLGRDFIQTPSSTNLWLCDTQPLCYPGGFGRDELICLFATGAFSRRKKETTAKTSCKKISKM